MAKNLIFIVAYNHERLIEKVVARIPSEILNNPENELLIIDDGSRDRTFFASDEIRQKLSAARITVLKNPINQGYGGNQKLGYRYAIDQGFDRVFLIHGDGQYAPELLTDFLTEYEKKDSATGHSPDAVFGTRMAQGTRALKGGMPLYKFIGNKILTKLQNKILKSQLSEFHSGYRSYSTALLKKIPFEVNSNDFHFDTEIIIQSLATGGKIVELPIPTHYGDEICHVNGMDYAKNVLLASLRFRIQQMGFLYDRKFDITGFQNPLRFSEKSAVCQMANQVEKNSSVLVLSANKNEANSKLHGLLVEKNCSIQFVHPLYELELAQALQKNFYNYILLPDVLEDLMEPEKTLDIIRKLCLFENTQGIIQSTPAQSLKRPTIICSTINVGFFIVRLMLFLGQFNYGVRGILDKNHRRLFTAKSLKQLFVQSGYEVAKIKGIPMPFTFILGGDSTLSRALEKINSFATRILPGLSSYQLLVSAKPLPTTDQLLKLSKKHSDHLRSVKDHVKVESFPINEKPREASLT